MKTYTFTLDEEQTKKLLDILDMYQDEGPTYAGWKSSELRQLEVEFIYQKELQEDKKDSSK